ncbi:hypothetical protein HMPREF1869_01000 [Bacteroidales bacterium KA00251]|nr:hypothetical protein HMPREF1869_01000 [Bacteroidales bacterium KA00251]
MFVELKKVTHGKYKKGYFIAEYPFSLETVDFCNSLTILLARLSRLCRKDEAQGAEGEV